MLSQGHPLFNDARYGGDRILKGTTFAKYRQFVENCFSVCPRQALHARTLGFRHPATGEEMNFECPIPPDMESLFEKWRAYDGPVKNIILMMILAKLFVNFVNSSFCFLSKE